MSGPLIAMSITDRTYRIRPVPERLRTFGREVDDGLSATPKRLPWRCFQDEDGARLYDELAAHADHRPARAEADVLAAHADDIASAAGPDAAVVELLSGQSARTRSVLEALLRRHRPVRYCPIGPAEATLRRTADGLLHDLRGIDIEAHAGMEEECLDLFFEGEPPPLLIACLGSTLERRPPGEAEGFLAALRRRARPFDQALIRLDLKTDRREATRDDAGPAERFHRNALLAINRQLGGGFDPESFDVTVDTDEPGGRVVWRLKSRAAQVVRIEALDRYVSLEEGEGIETMSSYTHTPGDIAGLCAQSGWTPVHRWTDDRKRVSVMLLTPAPGQALTKRARVAI